MWRQRRRWRRRRGGRGEVDAWCWRSRRRGGRGEVDAASEDGIGDRDGEVPVERSEEALRQQRGHWQPWWPGRGVVGPGGLDKLLAGRSPNYPRCAYARSGSGPREVGIIIQHMDDYYSITDNLEYSNSFDDYSRDTIYDNDIDDLVPIFEVFMAAIAGPEDDKAAAAWLARELAKEQARREDDRR
ncbi:hypothetical protein OsJ_18326 [Oryza sativa Japonica Group]|uniref:Uncharacterized protein n=1 Tax=Oryza sativa subsp. japonica TaxID=39947 RepID=B9FHS9_ORYSJ|nr:hypothetical protein OsJ_18326 [Oryza sativa Japonica Group]